ncbi:MAG: hypothetical protein PHO36_13065 [Parabacteroides sp.]|nr:hypothetical protein [Parabacteroides sp.]
MKLFGYLLVACAGLGLFACSTEDDPTIENGDGAKKSVSLKLNGIAGSLNTKAIETGTGGVTGDQENIILQDLKIVFYDNSDLTGPRPIYRVEEFDGTSTDPTAAANWAALTGLDDGDGYVFHNLDPNVTAVLVVGNYKNKGGTVSSPTTNIDWDNVASIESSVLLAKEENLSVPNNSSTPPDPTNSTKNYVTLWGKADLSNVDVPDFEDDTHNGTPTISKWKAAVTIEPLVARMEIGNIQCDNLGTMYDWFKLKGIGLVEMCLENSIDGNYISNPLMVDEDIYETIGETPAGKYTFGLTPIDWAYDNIPLVQINNNTDIYNYNLITTAPATPTGQKFIYNFFPGNGFPNIKLVLTDVMTMGGGYSGFNYVATASFQEDDDIHPLAGYIYKVDLKFKEINIGPWNPDNFICVIVKVTVTPWTIMSLTPVFH